MTPAPKIGLLPFYLELYDELLPDARAGFDGFVGTIVSGESAVVQPG